MATNKVFTPFPFFPDTKGEPLEAGYVYIGEAGSNPEDFPIAVYWDRALTDPADQPIRTIAGYLSRSGSPANLYVDVDIFSITVRDKQNRLVHTDLFASKAVPFGSITGTSTAVTKVESVDALINAALTVDDVYVSSYYGGWAGTVAGPIGGHYRHKTGATNTAPSVGSPVPVSTIGTGVQAGYVWDVSGAEWRLTVPDDQVSVLFFGAVSGNELIDTVAFEDCAQYLAGIGGGTFYVPETVTPFYLYRDIELPSNSAVYMDGFAFRHSTETRSFDCMFIPIPGAINVRFERMLLDCNNVDGISGGIIRRNNVGCSVGYAFVKNASTSVTLGGGRGWIIEDGVTGEEPKLAVIDTLVVEDSFNGLGFNGGFGSVAGDKNNSTNLVKSITCNNVEVPIGLYGNNPQYPHNGQEMSLIIDSVICFNCGNVTSSQPPASTIDGLIGCIRACNIQINSFYVYNTTAYTSGANIRAWSGEYKNCHVNMVIDSELDIVVRDGAIAISFNEAITTTSGSPIVTVPDTDKIEVGYSITGTGVPGGTTVLSVDSNTQITMSANATASGTVSGNFSGTAVCKDSTFNIQVNRDIATDLFVTSITGANHLVNNNFNFKINKILTNRMVPVNANNQTTNFLRIQSKEHDCHVWGKVGTGNIISGFNLSNFVGYQGQLGEVVASDVNGQPHVLTVNTANQLLVDGTYANLMQSFTVATLPSAATFIRTLIYVSDETGGPTPAFSDGVNWRRVTDLAVVS